MSKIVVVRLRRFVQITLVALALASIDAYAQEPQQTPEGAMAFLGKTLIGSRYSISMSKYSWHHTVKGFAAESKCSATFMLKSVDEDQMLKPEGYPHTFRFDEVAEVTSNPEESSITTKSLKGQGLTTFTLASSAISSRVAYAMEFLRKSCDPTAGTGF